MLDIGPDKIVVVAAIAFLLLGPDRIPQLARSIQRARGHVRELTRAIPPEAVQMIREPRRVLMDALGDAPRAIEDAFKTDAARPASPAPPASPVQWASPGRPASSGPPEPPASPVPDDVSFN
jgi:sec-independent protein translocase protein TatB